MTFEALLLRKDIGKFCADFLVLDVCKSTEIRIIPINGRMIFESTVILTPTPLGRDILQHCLEVGALKRMGWGEHFIKTN